MSETRTTTPSVWHALEVEAVEARLGTSATVGLDDGEAQRRLIRHGPNTVEVEATRAWWPLLIRQFTGPLIWILIVAAGISLAVGERLEAVAVIAIVVVNGVLGFVQEWKADRAIDELQSMFVQHARVRRGGATTMVDAVDLVPGDVIELEAGDRVPADARIVASPTLGVDESALTGESVPVHKDPSPADEGAPIAERTSLVYLGTQVTAGRATAIVVATGPETEFGDVVTLTGSVTREATPLQSSLASLGRRLGIAAVAVAILTVAIGLVAGEPASDMLLTGISLAVAAVPEGLPAVVTVTLAMGVRSMSQRKALLRQLEAAETLGAATVICTDKTGTLTENRMTVLEVWTDAGVWTRDAPREVMNRPITDLFETGRRCNHAALKDDGSAVGDPIETALLVAADTAGVPPSSVSQLREVPFDSTSKIMTVVSAEAAGPVAHVKGAPEVVLARCSTIRGSEGDRPLDHAARSEIDRVIEEMTASGMRLLALARRALPSVGDGVDHDLVFLGLVGMSDPPRPEVPDAVRMAHEAGITVVVMTGDAPGTGLAIAQQVGLPVKDTITGDELDRLDDERAVACLDGSRVLARVSPAHKMRMVRLLQGEGAVVAMTGDGVNDAPALQQASVGVAMGQRGTDVARGAADVVLADDNFASIVAAIEEGRRQYANIAKFISYLLSANLGEIVAITGSLMFGWPLILLPAQILWMNLVTDGVTALALGLERAEPDLMQRPPRPRHEHILTRTRLWWIVGIGTLIGVVTGIVFRVTLGSGEGDDLARAQTLAFTAMVLLECANVLNFRSERQSLAATGMWSNRWLLAALAAAIAAQSAAVHLPGLSDAMGTVPLSMREWAVLALIALPLIGVGEAAKALRRR